MAVGELLLLAFVPLKPPSVNSLYQVLYRFHRIELRPDIRLFKSRLKHYLPKVQPITTPIPVSLLLRFLDNWHWKKGGYRKLDLPNLEKCVTDAVFEHCGLDDSLIFHKETFKVQAEDRIGIEIELREYE